MLIFMIGPSACGKGTQAELLAKKFNIPHVSVGDLLRKEIEKQTEIGKFVEPIISRGDFVPGNVAFNVLADTLENDVDFLGGAIVDGFPRTFNQALEIDPIVRKHESEFIVIHYTLSYEECERRQQHRISQGVIRHDDKSLKERYDSYLKDLDKIREFYLNRNELIEIDANPSVEEIQKETLEKLEQKFNA